MQLIITDLTEMSPGNYCVAGWDAQARRMVRPLPAGRNWTAALLQRHGVHPGATVGFVRTNHPHGGSYPHSTEDTRVDPDAIQHLAAGNVDWFGAGAPPVHGTVAEAFAGHVAHNNTWHNVRQGIHVIVGTQTVSLAAVQRPRGSVQFIEETFGNEPSKLRAILDDGTARYKLAVSSLKIKSAWRDGGLAAVHQALPQSAWFHIRLGLARAFDNPPQKCYMMINGIHG